MNAMGIKEGSRNHWSGTGSGRYTNALIMMNIG